MTHREVNIRCILTEDQAPDNQGAEERNEQGEIHDPRDGDSCHKCGGHKDDLLDCVGDLLLEETIEINRGELRALGGPEGAPEPRHAVRHASRTRELVFYTATILWPP